MPESTKHLRKITSFARRTGRKSPRQSNALTSLWSDYGLELKDGLIDFQTFKRPAPVILEIGFGMGKSLLAMAKAMPDYNFIGIEVHAPGIGSLLADLAEEGIDNVRIYCADAIEVLQHCIPDDSLSRVQIFFPDPWPKRRHHKRRLIQSSFVELVCSKLKMDGQLHLATDWENYAQHIMQVLSSIKLLKNHFGEQQFASTTARPSTKYEQRGRNLGHAVWELVFDRV
jgi:tRNA (guanine-N7-)-methyltransferase